jgi:hypothetical protein
MIASVRAVRDEDDAGEEDAVPSARPVVHC